jgi:hypothetical protein
MNSLLILACSTRKRLADAPMKAIERYDGPSWRVVRAALCRRPDIKERLVIWALSAELGLIPASRPIPSYDRRLDRRRADALAPLVAAQLAELARPYAAEGFAHALVCAGQVYLAAMARGEGSLAQLCRTQVEVTARNHPRGIGDHLAQLSTWLSQR